MQIEVWVLFTYGILSFLFGYYLRSKKIKYDKIINIILDYSLIITIAIFFSGIFLITDNDMKQAAFTFSSVYLGFWLGNERQRLDDKKMLKLFLGLLWQELRYNRHQLKVIESNFTFLFDGQPHIRLNAMRIGANYSLSGSLKNAAYNAYMTSGAISTLSSSSFKADETDEVFNAIESAYINIDYFKSFLFTVTTDFNQKAMIEGDLIQSPFINGAIGDMESKIKKAAQELVIAKRYTYNAVDVLENFLHKLGVKATEEELRKDVLSSEDKEIIARSIRKTHINPNEIYQKPDEE